MDNLRLASTVYAPTPALAPWRLEELLPGHEVSFHSFGRRALAAGLRASGIGPGENILLPEFICRDVLASLAEAGARALFYPVGASLEPAAPPQSWPAAKAVIAVNYFGFAQEMGPFQDYCRRTGALLVEDNAHGLFSRDSQSRLLGGRADVGIFSLRKSLPLPNGAALALRRGRSWKSGPSPAFGPSGGLRFKLKNSYRTLAGTCGPRLALRGLTLFRRARLALGAGPGEGNACERELPGPESPCPELARPLTAADPSLEVRRRQALYRLVESVLRDVGVVPVFSDLPPGTCPYAYPFRARPEQRPQAFAALAGLGLTALPWPDLPAAIRGRAPEHYGNVWLVHFLW